MITTKKDIRKQMKKTLFSLSFLDKLRFSERVFVNLKTIVSIVGGESVFIFKSMENEPSTDAIIDYCFENNKRVFVPKINGDIMEVIEVFADTQYQISNYGIKEPIDFILNNDDIKNKTEKNIYDISVNITPLVAFDSNCNRLGHGKGYYDKYLEKSKGINIGLAFDCQRVENLPIEPHDIPLNYIITEKKIYKNK